MLYTLARAVLFRLDPEAAHDLALKSLQALGPAARLLGQAPDGAGEACTVMGLAFPNRVGLAAGLDKNGEYLGALGTLGFGHIEIGTVTPRPQPGNAKPRLFRLTAQEALINRFGFNSVGVEQLLRNVEASGYRGVLGINIGKNAATPLERATDDYLACLDAVYARADYITVNISSPNTTNLRDLQSKERLGELLAALREHRARLAGDARAKPLVVKIAPDLDEAQLNAVADLALEHGIDGLIATNTTLSRDGVQAHACASEAGGLSGRPLFVRSTEVLRRLSARLGGRVALIGVGGILSGAEARAKVDAGASLVQVYTGFIYRGPALIAEARRAIVHAHP